MGIIGIIVIVLIAFLMCDNKKNINYKAVIISFVILLILAVFVLDIPIGIKIIQSIADAVLVVFAQGQVGIKFLFGDLASGHFGLIFAVTVLGNIVFFGALISLLYYLKIMPFIINCLTYILTKLIKTSRPETISAIATIFLGPGESQLIIKPFMPTLTKSELFCIMVSGLTAISGSVMAGYIGLGMSAKYIISATFMSIPASLFISKLILPETETPFQTLKELSKKNIDIAKDSNIVEAITHGTIVGLKMAAIIGAMLIAFISLIALANVILTDFGNLFHIKNLTLQKILGIILAPLAYIMGIPKADIFTAGSLIGTKTITNEFVAFVQMSKIMSTLNEKTKTIIIFTLCGFANIGTLGIIIGSTQTIAPTRVKEVGSLAIKALVAATLANLLNGCIAGIMFDLAKTLGN